MHCSICHKTSFGMMQINVYFIFITILNLSSFRNGMAESALETRNVLLQDYMCKFDFTYLTQYERALVTWNGNKFYVWCQRAFKGQNSKNVLTDYTVCFRVLDYRISDCSIKIEYRSLKYSVFSTDHTFGCGDTIISDWCTDASAGLKITAEEGSHSYLRLEVTVKAGTSLSIAQCIGIVVGVLIFIGIVGIICFRKYRNSRQSDGSVIRTEGRANDTTHTQPHLPMHDITGGQTRQPPPNSPPMYSGIPSSPLMYSAPPTVDYSAPPTVDYSAPPPSYSDCVKSGLIEATPENNRL